MCTLYEYTYTYTVAMRESVHAILFIQKREKHTHPSSWTIWIHWNVLILDTQYTQLLAVVIVIAAVAVDVVTFASSSMFPLTHTSLHVVYSEMERFHCVNKEIIAVPCSMYMVLNVLSKSYLRPLAPVKPGQTKWMGNDNRNNSFCAKWSQWKWLKRVSKCFHSANRKVLSNHFNSKH